MRSDSPAMPTTYVLPYIVSFCFAKCTDNSKRQYGFAGISGCIKQPARPIFQNTAATRWRIQLRFNDVKLGKIHAGGAFGAKHHRHSDPLVLRYLTNLETVFITQFPVEDLHVLPEPLPFQALDNHAGTLLVDPPQRNLGGQRKLVMW